MRTLAWILGLIAIGGSFFLSISGFIAYRGVQYASAAVGKAQEDLSDFQIAAEMESKHYRAVVELDEIQLHNDDLSIQIAELDGKDIAKARAQRSADGMKSVIDQNVEHLDELQNTFGNPNVSSAMDHLQASELSLGIYSAALTRDEHLAYAVGVVWLAFGFAVAFANQIKRESRDAP